MFKNVTLKDIAKECGCSVTTVSRALKDSDTLPQATKDKINQTANAMGYIPNSVATSMRTGSTRTIGVCVQDFRNPFYSSIAKYTEQYLRSKNYFALFATTNEEPEQEYNVIKSFLSKNVDGILLLPIQHDTQAVDLLLEQKKPFVLVGRQFEQLNTNSLVTADEEGGYLITNYLISKNARKILFLNAEESISSAKNRRAGYMRALEEHGLEPFVFNLSMEYGKTREFLIPFSAELAQYDAILVFCDIMGFEAYNTLLSMGYSIPQDMMLASFDGLQQDIILPIELTCAATDRKKMAEQAVDMLLELIDHEQPSPNLQHIVIDQYLLEGNTT